MAKAKGGTAGREQSFEEALARLEAIVKELEEAELPLEKSLEVFEEGVRLSRLLHERLNESERKVEVLLKSVDGELTTAPFPGAAGKSAEQADDAGGDDAGDGGTGQAGLF
jgi:exodeoxyribonuclease VII small subunit